MSKWNLNGFYESNEAFQKDLELLESRIDEMGQFKGHLNEKEGFKGFLNLDEELTHLIYKLYGYSHLSADLNLKDPDLQARFQSLIIKLNRLSSVTSYFSPELISVGKDAVMSFINADKELEEHRFPMEKLFKQQDHVLSDREEQLMSNFRPISSIPTQLYTALSMTDRQDIEVTLSDGTKKVINTSNWRSILPTVKDAKDREAVFAAAFKRYEENKDAFASTYNLVLQNMAASYKSRGYNSALESRLDGNDIPLDVFLTLKDTVYENTEPVKRYIKLRQKHLGLEKYNTYDRFLQLVSSDKKYSYQEGKKLFFEAIKDFDKEFIENQKRALEEGYVDVEPQDGKRTGAYSSGLYGFHPYILLNHDQTLDSVFTLVHEAGHSAHTIFSNEHQPMAISNYTIFVAEIASTFNERALADYLLKVASTKEEKIAIIESEIDGIMGTFYRQTLFAHYEYEANKLVEQGIPLNAGVLSKIMVDLYKHYYDIDITEEPGKQYVWAYIPHLFRTPFYVYQYASSYSASLKIYSDVKAGKKNAMEKYKNLLKSGGSDYPVNQARDAGADLTKKETFEAVVKRFNELIDQLESLLEG